MSRLTNAFSPARIIACESVDALAALAVELAEA